MTHYYHSLCNSRHYIFHQSPLDRHQPNTSKMSMYVRLKRKNQTIFLHIDPADNFFNIKQRVGELYALDPANIQLIGSDKKRELLDMATVSDQEVKNDDILYFLFTKDSGGGWEDIQVESFSTFAEESAESPARH